jgi:hypothetical protein
MNRRPHRPIRDHSKPLLIRKVTLYRRLRNSLRDPDTETLVTVIGPSLAASPANPSQSLQFEPPQGQSGD